MDADFQSQDVKIFRQWLLDELGAASGLFAATAEAR
jgi:hypothetical protein